MRSTLLSLLRPLVTGPTRAVGTMLTRRMGKFRTSPFPCAPRHQEEQRTLVNTIHSDTVDWNDRIGLQSQWKNAEKGWEVDVDWRETEFGVGLFAVEDIAKDTVLRVGLVGVNLMEFQSVDDIESFCQTPSREDNFDARLSYVKDYLWGFNKHTDRFGYSLPQTQGDDEDRFFGMWIPGNGLNHNLKPNTVYRATDKGINLVALRDIAKDEELYDDYRRHGKAPEWLRNFAKNKGVTLNFAECNDFVVHEPFIETETPNTDRMNGVSVER